MKVTTQWQNDLVFKGETADGHQILMDSDGKHASPMQMVLLAIGGCSSIDVVMILQRARQDITDCHCEITGDRAETIPKVFEKIHAHYTVKGRNLNQEQVKRACNLSMEKYCSVSLMLKGKVEVTYSVDIIEEA
ncbi:OsmC family protein [Aliikangiella maris]|uniref:OsmC family protein n=2 Tax=Aliikangiella maris TaxID=3162458 RepID=A0ABV3MSG4_9GAMM